MPLITTIVDHIQYYFFGQEIIVGAQREILFDCPPPLPQRLLAVALIA